MVFGGQPRAVTTIASRYRWWSVNCFRRGGSGTTGRARQVEHDRSSTTRQGRQVKDDRSSTTGQARQVKHDKSGTAGQARKVKHVRSSTTGSNTTDSSARTLITLPKMHVPSTMRRSVEQQRLICLPCVPSSSAAAVGLACDTWSGHQPLEHEQEDFNYFFCEQLRRFSNIQNDILIAVKENILILDVDPLCTELIRYSGDW